MGFFQACTVIAAVYGRGRSALFAFVQARPTQTADRTGEETPIRAHAGGLNSRVRDGHGSGAIGSIFFSGDLGGLHDLVIRRPVHLAEPHYLVLDSTYGDWLHAPNDSPEGAAADCAEDRAGNRSGTSVCCRTLRKRCPT